MHPPKIKNGKYCLSLFYHPLPKVLKFEKFKSYFEKITEIGTMLDYGSGSQLYRDFFKSMFKTYIPADFAPSNAIHEKKPDIYIDEEQKTNLPDCSVDCVSLMEVLEHIPEPDKALKEIYRVLKQGGYLIGSVPFFQNEHEVPFDFYRYTYFGLKRLFEKSNFIIVELEYVGGMVSVLIILISKFLKYIIKAFNKIHLGFISSLLILLFKIPEFIYFYLFKKNYMGIRIKRFSSLPLGFTFLLRKI